MHGLHGYSTVNNVTRPTVKHRCKKKSFTFLIILIKMRF